MTDSLHSLAARRRYAIIGSGALGGFYGARLQRAGLEVHFLLHRDYESVRQHGLLVESVAGDFRLPQVHAYQTVQEMPACDVVILALKTLQNHLLPDLLPPLMKSSGVVLVLQNGLGIEPEVAAVVGQDRVMGGLCFLCSNKIGAGHIRHLDYGQITLGDYANGYQPCGFTARMQQVAADFQQAGIVIEQSGDLFLARWKKLVWNIPFNGLSVVLNATTAEMMANEMTYALAQSLMQEVLKGAAACMQRVDLPNRQISPDFVKTMLDYTR